MADEKMSKMRRMKIKSQMTRMKKRFSLVLDELI
jgi:hypothetical protein